MRAMPGSDEACDEVVVVDAGKREVSLPRGLAGHLLCGQALDRPVGVDDRLRLLHVGAEAAALRLDVHAVAKARPPLDRRIQRRVGVGDLHRKGDDVGLGIHAEHFLRAQPVAAVELEGQGRRRRRRVDRGRRRRAKQRRIQSRALALVGETQREGPRRRGRQPRRHQVDRLARLIEVPQELPALHDRAAVAEGRAHRARVDDDVALSGVGDEGLRGGNWSGRVNRRRGRRGVGGGLGRCGGCPGRLGDHGGRWPRCGPLRLRHDRLVRVEHQEREEDGNQNTLFHEHLRALTPKRSERAPRRHRVVSRPAKGATARQPAHGQPRARKQPVCAQRVGGVGRARRMKSTRPGEQGRDHELVRAKRRQRDPHGQHSQRAVDPGRRRPRVATYSASRLAKGAPTRGRLGTTTMSKPAGAGW